MHNKTNIKHNNHRHYDQSHIHDQNIRPSQKQQQSHSHQPHPHNHNQYIKPYLHKRKTDAAMNVITVKGRRMLQLKRIGRGGSSEVYQVITRDTHEILALKKITVPLSIDPNIKRDPMENFQNEIDLLLKLRYKPYCIQMLEYEIENDLRNNCTKIRMLFECGEIDLAHLLKKQSKGYYTDTGIISTYFKQMLLAVNTIHDFRIVHGDLKPANFLMVQGELKLIDFGIAKQIKTNETTHIARDSQIGTLNYISPEALLPAPDNNNNNDCYKLGRPADVWSMGCILHQMCFGFTPFTHLKLASKLSVIVSKSCKKYIKLHQNPLINEIVTKCLLRKPNHRITVDQLINHRFCNPFKDLIHK